MVPSVFCCAHEFSGEAAPKSRSEKEFFSNISKNICRTAIKLTLSFGLILESASGSPPNPLPKKNDHIIFFTPKPGWIPDSLSGPPPPENRPYHFFYSKTLVERKKEKKNLLSEKKLRKIFEKNFDQKFFF